ncbi:hypothetical protein S83_028951, partial [Arachis hypogaea]
ICCWYEYLIFFVSEGMDRDLRTNFKGIRDLCGSGIVYLSCTPKTSLLLMINKSLMRLCSR